MKKTVRIFDSVLSFCVLLLFFFIAVRYFVPSVVSAAALALTFTLCTLFFTGKWAEKKRAPRVRKQKLTELCNKFLFSPPDYALDYVYNALCTKGTPRQENGLLVLGQTAFCVCLTPDKVRTAFLAERFAAAGALPVRRLVFLSAYGADEEAAQTAPCLHDPCVEIWAWEKVYDFFCYLHCPPTQTLPLVKDKSRPRYLRHALRRENARHYLIAAVVTLLFARFMPYAVLYVVIAALCLTLSVACRCRPKNTRRDGRP